MQTSNFNDLLRAVGNLCGLDQENLGTDFFNFVADAADSRLAQAWETEFWPDLIRITEHTPTQDGAGSQAFYKILIGNISFSVDTWLPGEILEVFDNDPRSTTKATPVPWTLTTDNSGNDCIVVRASAAVFVQWRIQRPSLIGLASYSAGTTYYPNDVAYSVSGAYDLWRCKLKSTGNAVSNGTYWHGWGIPRIFYPFLVKACQADWLRANGQEEPAMIAEQRAEQLLSIESDKLVRQSGQHNQVQLIR